MGQGTAVSNDPVACAREKEKGRRTEDVQRTKSSAERKFQVLNTSNDCEDTYTVEILAVPEHTIKEFQKTIFHS